MVIGIVYNSSKIEAVCYEKMLEEMFMQRNITFIRCPKEKLDEWKIENADAIISIGGDGTFLKVAIKALAREIPVLGINLGTIGFLTECEKDTLDRTIERLISGDYEIEKRSILDVYLESGNESKFLGNALNDCVVTREIEANVCYLKLKINDQLVGTYPSDGIIVATQTGSTAYSLSAGGPIIEPGNDVVVVTPICSHRMGSRSIVARSSSVIKITPVIKNKKMRVVLDGNKSFKVSENDNVICKTSEKKALIIRIDPPNFYNTVSTKLFREEDFPGGGY